MQRSSFDRVGSCKSDSHEDVLTMFGIRSLRFGPKPCHLMSRRTYVDVNSPKAKNLKINGDRLWYNDREYHDS